MLRDQRNCLQKPIFQEIEVAKYKSRQTTMEGERTSVPQVVDRMKLLAVLKVLVDKHVLDFDLLVLAQADMLSEKRQAIYDDRLSMLISHEETMGVRRRWQSHNISLVIDPGKHTLHRCVEQMAVRSALRKDTRDL